MVSVVMLVTCLFSLSVLAVSGQLIGSRGVISLRPGQVYRDRLTVEASEVAARLALLLDREETILGRPQVFRSVRTENIKTTNRPFYVLFAGFPSEKPRQSTGLWWGGLVLVWGDLWRTTRYLIITTVGLSGLTQPSSSTSCWRRWRWREPRVPPEHSPARDFRQAFTLDLPGLPTDWPTLPSPLSPRREQRMPS